MWGRFIREKKKSYRGKFISEKNTSYRGKSFLFVFCGTGPGFGLSLMNVYHCSTVLFNHTKRAPKHTRN